jgi:hypothetical protein
MSPAEPAVVTISKGFETDTRALSPEFIVPAVLLHRIKRIDAFTHFDGSVLKIGHIDQGFEGFENENSTTNVWLPVSVVVKKTFRPHRLDPPS